MTAVLGDGARPSVAGQQRNPWLAWRLAADGSAGRRSATGEGRAAVELSQAEGVGGTRTWRGVVTVGQRAGLR